jgi:hypothetical protein
MHARERRDRLAGIQMGDDPCGGVELEIDVAPRDSVERRVWCAADVGEPFRAQQGLGDLPGRDADGDIMAEPDRGRLRRPLVGERRPSTEKAGGAGQRQAQG